jgi:hypothetical protein
MRQKYTSRRKEIVQWDYFTDGTYGETRLYKSWVYKRPDGSEFIFLEYPISVKRDYKGKPYVERKCYSGAPGLYNSLEQMGLYP